MRSTLTSTPQRARPTQNDPAAVLTISWSSYLGQRLKARTRTIAIQDWHIFLGIAAFDPGHFENKVVFGGPEEVAAEIHLQLSKNAYDRVFLNRCRRPITRFGIHTMVERYSAKAGLKMPSVANKRISPHTIRHSTASHLLRAGVDINTIRAWLGHVSLDTTNIYAETDLEMALATCELAGGAKSK